MSTFSNVDMYWCGRCKSTNKLPQKALLVNKPSAVNNKLLEKSTSVKLTNRKACRYWINWRTLVRSISWSNCSKYRRFWNTLSKIRENTIPKRLFDNNISVWNIWGEKFIGGYENNGGNSRLLVELLGLGHDDSNLNNQKKIGSLVKKLFHVSFDLIAIYFSKKRFQKKWRTYQSERRNCYGKILWKLHFCSNRLFDVLGLILKFRMLLQINNHQQWHFAYSDKNDVKDETFKKKLAYTYEN